MEHIELTHAIQEGESMQLHGLKQEMTTDNYIPVLDVVCPCFPSIVTQWLMGLAAVVL